MLPTLPWLSSCPGLPRRRRHGLGGQGARSRAVTGRALEGGSGLRSGAVAGLARRRHGGLALPLACFDCNFIGIYWEQILNDGE